MSNKVYRNPQEQLQYVTDEVEAIKQSLGSALPDPIPGPTGATGPAGPKGNTGDRGPGIVGYGTELPASAQEGDMFILRTTVPGGTIDYVMYKWCGYHWLPQFSMRGPAGPIGPEGGTEVVANPVDAASDDLSKLKIDGVTYDVLSSSLRAFLTNISGGELSYTAGVGYNFGDNPVVFEYPVTFNSSAIFDYGIWIDDLSQITDSEGNPMVIIENLKDANGHNRFTEGTIDTETISGVTWTYNKWVLSGNHLMLVLAGEVASGTTLSVQSLGGVDFTGDNAWINDKIVPLFASSVIAINDVKGYYDDWNSNNMQTTLMKTSTGVYFYLIQNPTYSQTGHFRIQFDLLID